MFLRLFISILVPFSFIGTPIYAKHIRVGERKLLNSTTTAYSEHQENDWASIPGEIVTDKISSVHDQARSLLQVVDIYDLSMSTPNGMASSIAHQDEIRKLQGNTTMWSCMSEENEIIGHVHISSGQSDSALKTCKDQRFPKSQTIRAIQVMKSVWNCFRESDLKHVGSLVLSSNHNIATGKWACGYLFGSNNYLVTGGVANPGGSECFVYRRMDGCSGGGEPCQSQLRGPCNQHDACYSGPISGSFRDTFVKCNNLLKKEASGNCANVANIWMDAANVDPLATFGQLGGPGFGQSFWNNQRWVDRTCTLGRSAPAGYTGVPCWGSNTRCLAGTSCYNCCNGDRWVWEWFGHHCN